MRKGKSYVCKPDGDVYRVTVLERGARVGVMFVCRRDHAGGNCGCEGSWVDWGFDLSSHELNTLPHRGPNPLTGV